MITLGILSISLPNFIGMAFNTFVGGTFLLASLVLALNAWHNKKTCLYGLSLLF